jgi:hypothetical protein
MSKYKYQGLGRAICIAYMGLFLSTTSLFAMQEPSDPGERKTISKKRNPQLPPVQRPDSSPAPSLSSIFYSNFEDKRGD